MSPCRAVDEPSYLEQLESRILRLESDKSEEFQQLASPSTSTTSFVRGVPVTQSVPTQLWSEPSVPGSHPDRNVLVDTPSSARHIQVPTTSTAIDGMGLLLAAESSPAERAFANTEREVYGESSGISFHRLLLDTLLPGNQITSKAAQEPEEEESDSGFLGLPTSEAPYVARPEDFPTRAEANHMWAYFTQHTLQLYPFVDLDNLKESYDGLLEAVRNPGQSEPLSEPRNQPMIAFHFVIFALVQNLSEAHRTQCDGACQLP